MRITVQVNREATERLRSSRGQKARGGATAPLRWLKHPLQPVHSSTTDPSLRTFFTVEADNRAEADALVQRLLHDPAVEAAYIKPDDEPA